MSNVGNIHRESKNCSLVAKIVMILGVIWGIAFIVAFGQVEPEMNILRSSMFGQQR